MSVDIDTVKRVARLARIAVTEEEAGRMTGDEGGEQRRLDGGYIRVHTPLEQPSDWNGGDRGALFRGFGWWWVKDWRC